MRRIYKYNNELFASAVDLAFALDVNQVSLRSYIIRNKITSGTFEYRGHTIEIVK